MLAVGGQKMVARGDGLASICASKKESYSAIPNWKDCD